MAWDPPQPSRERSTLVPPAEAWPNLGYTRYGEKKFGEGFDAGVAAAQQREEAENYFNDSVDPFEAGIQAVRTADWYRPLPRGAESALQFRIPDLEQRESRITKHIASLRLRKVPEHEITQMAAEMRRGEISPVSHLQGRIRKVRDSCADQGVDIETLTDPLQRVLGRIEGLDRDRFEAGELLVIGMPGVRLGVEKITRLSQRLRVVWPFQTSEIPEVYEQSKLRIGQVVQNASTDGLPVIRGNHITTTTDALYAAVRLGLFDDTLVETRRGKSIIDKVAALSVPQPRQLGAVATQPVVE